MLLVPTALAASSLSASTLEITGTSSVTGEASALLAIADENGFTWEVTAAQAVLTRTFTDTIVVTNPRDPVHPLYSKDPGWSESTDTFTGVTIASKGVDLDGALLALGPSAALATTSEGRAAFESILDPQIHQAAPDAEAPDADSGLVSASLAGEYLKLTLEGAEATITGDITLRLSGPSYLISSAEGSSEERTGVYETSRTALVSEGRKERHELVLTDAVLTLRTPALLEAYTEFPQIAFSGTLAAFGAEGALVLADEEIAPADGALSWTGASTVTLAPASGRMLAAAPAPVLASSATISQGPPLAAFGVALGILLFLAAVAAIVIVRRRAGQDDLAVALLAMEERRWEAALPPLTRLAKKDPSNANILVDRALCLEQAGRVELAAKAYETALRAAPRHAEAHFYYARTLAKMRESEAARVHLETALEHDPRLVEMARGERVLRGL